MPHTFLYKRKKKSYSKSVIDVTNSETPLSVTRGPSPSDEGTKTTNDVNIDVISVPSYPPPALNKITVAQRRDEVSSTPPGDPLKLDDIKVNRVRGIQNPAPAKSIETPLFVDTSSIFDFDSVYRRSANGNIFQNNWINGFSRTARHYEDSNGSSDSKLRGYLESSKRPRKDDGDAIITVENPWVTDSPRFYRPFLSTINRSSDKPGFFRSLPKFSNTTSDDKRPVPSPERDEQKPSVSADAEERRSVDRYAAWGSFYRSYFYPGSYYSSMYFKQLKEWHEAHKLANKINLEDRQKPFSSIKNTLHGMAMDYHPEMSRVLQYSSDDAKERKTGLDYFGVSFGKNSARPPVPGVEYLKNDVEMEPTTSKWDSEDKRWKSPPTDNQCLAQISGSIISRGEGDVQRLSTNPSLTQIDGTHPRIATGYDGPTLSSILNAPVTRTYRGGRRSASGKPPQPRKYVCDVCGKAFSRSNTLVTHKRIHTGDKPFSCELCGRAFRQPGNLTRHRLTHTTVKPYVCSQCGKAFNRASNLHTHMRTHTNYKPFVCEFCGKGFHQKIDMKIHSYTHTGEKPHKCKTCGRGFKQLTHLTYHMRTHSEVKMYSCNYCGKGFNQKGNLQAHIYRHTGERPHQCTVCNKGFTLASTLNTHRRTHEVKGQRVNQQHETDFRKDGTYIQ